MMPMLYLDKLAWFFDPYSIEGLKRRAKRLPDCPYKVLLELCIVQLEKKIVSKDLVKEAIGYFRTGNYELLVKGVGMLNLSHDQIQEVLSLLKTGKIKEVKREDA